jgi:hypothetical protein
VFRAFIFFGFVSAATILLFQDQKSPRSGLNDTIPFFLLLYFYIVHEHRASYETTSRPHDTQFGGQLWFIPHDGSISSTVMYTRGYDTIPFR